MNNVYERENGVNEQGSYIRANFGHIFHEQVNFSH